MIVFDIETGPLDQDVILATMPPFDPADVKVGNLGPEKAAAKIKAAEEDYYTKAIERAALSPLTGHVLSVGYLPDNEDCDLDVVNNSKIDPRTERDLLIRFWVVVVAAARDDTYPIVGHNIFGFDLPFLVRRSWILDIEVPSGVLRGRYFNDRLFCDTMQMWRCGMRDSLFVSLDTLAKTFGVGCKPEGIDGGMFADLLETDRQVAIDYLRNDLEMTAAVAAKMGLF